LNRWFSARKNQCFAEEVKRSEFDFSTLDVDRFFQRLMAGDFETMGDYVNRCNTRIEAMF